MELSVARSWSQSQLRKTDYWVVVILWLLFETLWLSIWGFNFSNEGAKYIKEAVFLNENGFLSNDRFIFYSTTISLIALCTTIGIDYYGAVGILMIFNLLCYLYFFKASVIYFKSKIIGLSIVIFLLSFWPFQEWTLTLYSESLFFSCIMLLLGLILSFERTTRWFVFYLTLLLLLLVFTRPLGILFLLPAVFFLFFHLTRKQKVILFMILIFSVALLIYVVQVVFTTTTDWSMDRAILDESIICDMPVEKSGYVPALSNNSNQLYRLFYYVTNNFEYFISIALERLKFFFFMVRDYYSRAHNLYLICFLSVIYLSILAGSRRLSRVLGKSRVIFIFSTVILFATTVALQCDDYHNRFFLGLFPLLTVASAAAIASFIKRPF